MILLLLAVDVLASSLPSWNPESLAAATDCVIRGTATSAERIELDDGTILFDVRLGNVSSLGPICGQHTLNTIRLSPDVISEPVSLVGRDVVAFVVFRGGYMYHWGGPGAFFRDINGKAMTGDLLPVVDLPCRGPALVARPLSQMTIALDDGSVSQSSPHRLFADDPLALAAPWEDLVNRVQGCVQNETESRP